MGLDLKPWRRVPRGWEGLGGFGKPGRPLEFLVLRGSFSSHYPPSLAKRASGRPGSGRGSPGGGGGGGLEGGGLGETLPKTLRTPQSSESVINTFS